MKRWRKIRALPPADRYLLVRVALLMGALKVALWLLPFGVVRRVLMRLTAGHVQPAFDEARERRRIVRAVKAVGRRMLGDKPCLPEALIVQLLFRRRGYPADLRIGIMKDEAGRFMAHAWVESGDEIVVGGSTSPQVYVPLPPIQV